jgi:CDP-diglyceride synthetase
MKKPNCCKRICNRSFKEEGKILFISLLLVWFLLAILTEELDPTKWPTLLKPLLLILTSAVFGYLSGSRQPAHKLHRKKEEK